MKKITFSLALLSVALLAYDASAQEPGKRPGQRGPAEKGAGRGQERNAGGPAAERDPAQMVARLMQEFDKDGDKKLDSTELTALLTSMRDRRGGAGQGEARTGRPGQARPGQTRQGQSRPGAEGQRAEGQRAEGQRAEGQRAEGQRRGRRADDAGKPGGERPERPDEE